MSSLVERSGNRVKNASRQEVHLAAAEMMNLALILDSEIGDLGVSSLSKVERDNLIDAMAESPELLAWVFSRSADSGSRH